MEYWHPFFLLDMAIGIGEPLRIDEKTLKKELQTYAKILIDIDFTKLLPEEILVQRERFEFIMKVEYENYPSFCRQYGSIGHDDIQCRLRRR